MKKIAFALQVLGLITTLPLYVIIEMNHKTIAAKGANPVAPVTKEVTIIPGSPRTIAVSEAKI